LRREYALEILSKSKLNSGFIRILQSRTYEKTPFSDIYDELARSLEEKNMDNLRKLPENYFEKVIGFLNRYQHKKIPSYYTIKKILEDLEKSVL
jgi:hypothetical protein